MLAGVTANCRDAKGRPAIRPVACATWPVVLMLFALAGCGHVEGRTSNPESGPTVTLGGDPKRNDDVTTSIEPPAVIAEGSHGNVVTAEQTTDAGSSAPKIEATATTANDPAPPPTQPAPTSEARTFKVEGPENAIRVSYDDFDLLKVLNLDPVPPDAPERLPAWLKALDGKRIRVRGFMYPPPTETGIRGFVLARDNQICCFGRTPKEYDLVDVFLRKGVSTYYIQNRPFDVVGLFRIKTEIEKYTAMYELEDALVMEK